MIIQGAVADDGAQFVRSLQKLSYNPKILFQTNAPTDEAYPSAIGGAANADGVFTAQSWSATATYPGNPGFVTGVHEDVRRAAHRGRRQLLHRRPGPRGGRQGRRQPQPERARQLAARPHGQPRSSARSSGTSRGDPEGSLLLSQWQHGTLQVVAPASAATSKTVLLAKPAWGNG